MPKKIENYKNYDSVIIIKRRLKNHQKERTTKILRICERFNFFFLAQNH